MSSKTFVLSWIDPTITVPSTIGPSSLAIWQPNLVVLDESGTPHGFDYSTVIHDVDFIQTVLLSFTWETGPSSKVILRLVFTTVRQAGANVGTFNEITLVNLVNRGDYVDITFGIASLSLTKFLPQGTTCDDISNLLLDTAYDEPLIQFSTDVSALLICDSNVGSVRTRFFNGLNSLAPPKTFVLSWADPTVAVPTLIGPANLTFWGNLQLIELPSGTPHAFNTDLVTSNIVFNTVLLSFTWESTAPEVLMLRLVFTSAQPPSLVGTHNVMRMMNVINIGDHFDISFGIVNLLLTKFKLQGTGIVCDNTAALTIDTPYEEPLIEFSTNTNLLICDTNSGTSRTRFFNGLNILAPAPAPGYDCNSSAKPYTCDPVPFGTGSFDDLALCLAGCDTPPDWNCDQTSYTCSQIPFPGGQYPTQGACDTACLAPSPSYDCNQTGTLWTCDQKPYGEGPYENKTLCESACVSPSGSNNKISWWVWLIIGLVILAILGWIAFHYISNKGTGGQKINNHISNKSSIAN